MSKWGEGRGGRPWRRLRLKVFARDRYTCRKCHHVTPDPECDHILGVALGGTDDIDNLQTMCVACHADKTAQEANGGKPVRKVQTIGIDGWPIVSDLTQELWGATGGQDGPGGGRMKVKQLPAGHRAPT